MLPRILSRKGNTKIYRNHFHRPWLRDYEAKWSEEFLDIENITLIEIISVDFHATSPMNFTSSHLRFISWYTLILKRYD